jgi:chromate transporter
MSEAGTTPREAAAGISAGVPKSGPGSGPGIGRIFLEFLTIGATSFGGVVPYLRGSLVTRRQWLNDKEFVELLSISQSLPGLNATNMGILVGEKLGGAPGAMVALLGICLPGGLLMFIVGIVYRAHGDYAWTTASLKGVAAASVGLILATVVELSRRSLEQHFDYVFVALTVIAISRFHQSVPITLIVVGLMAILWHRPRKGRQAEAQAETVE